MPFADLPGDARLHYKDDDFSDPWQPGETVVLQHGQAKSARLWYAWVPLLAREYRVIRVDSRGFGQSPLPPPEFGYSMDCLADDVVHLMDHLDIQQAHVIGDTVGGASLLPNGHLAIIPRISRATHVAPEKSVAAWRDFIREFHSGRSART
jgi:pimeloyl-ACP methyl ester carboxylesterase